MKPTIVLPQLPDTTDPVAVKEYLSAHQKILADKQKDDYETSKANQSERYPVGTWYTQYPSVKSNDEAVAFPESEEPANKFGGVWTEPFAGEYTFFRTTGVNGQTRVNGFSLDQVLDHIHWASSRYYSSGTPSYAPAGSSKATGGPSWVTSGIHADYRKGYFNEVRNYLVKVWYRES